MPRITQHVYAHRAAGPLVHRRQPGAVPDQFEISRVADQGHRERIAAACWTSTSACGCRGGNGIKPPAIPVPEPATQPIGSLDCGPTPNGASRNDDYEI